MFIVIILLDEVPLIINEMYILYCRVHAKRRYKDQKFGFGGKKRGMKRNTKNSTSDVSEFRRPGKPKRPGAAQKHQRPGKNKRLKMKSKRKK
jgi:rRNA-processing protein EBP2